MPDDPNAGPGSQENQRPDWLPDNFDSPEAFASSYKEAQQKITSQGQELAQLREDYESLTELAASLQTAPPQQQYQQQENPLETIAAQYGFDPEQIQLMSQLAAQAADYRLNQWQQQQQPDWQRSQQAQIQTISDFATERLRAHYPDFAEKEEQIEQTIRGNNALQTALADARTPLEFGQVLDQAYKLVSYEEYVAGQRQQQQAEAAKLAAQSATGAGPGRIMSPDAQQAEWERIRNAGSSSPWTS